MNVDDRVEAVVLTREQNFRFEMINERLGIFYLRGELVEHRFTFTRKLHERLHVVQALRYLTIEIEAFFETGALLKDLAGAILVGPEAWICNLLLQVIELALFGAGVKETSGRPRFAISTVQTVQ